MEDANAAAPAGRIFVSYAHADEAWKKLLFEKQLQLPSGIPSVWQDRMIEPGSAWLDEIERGMQRAQAAILLVSEAFFRSTFIGNRELPTLLERRTKAGLKLLWIPIGELGHLDLGPLGPIQALFDPKNALPPEPSRDPEVARRAAEAVRSLLEEALDPVGVGLMRELQSRYERFEFVARTGSTLLYKTRHSQLDRTVVIKALADLQMREVFQANLRGAVAFADEPQFANVYEVVLDSHRPYCTMQYIRGKNLRQTLETDGVLPLDRTVRILEKIARSLRAVHALGNHYGNLKPSNVMLSEKGEPYILPMGREIFARKGAQALAELRQRVPDAEELAYLPPEQLDAAMVPGELSDQYMLGLLAWQLVTGRLPPTLGEGLSVEAALARLEEKGKAAFVPLPVLTSVPEFLSETIRRMTQIDSQRRYPSLEKLVDALRGQRDVVLMWVRDSFNRCMKTPQRQEAFFADVYRRFFAAVPEAVALFAKDAADTEAVIAGLKERQFDSLERAIVSLFAFYQQERTSPREPNVLTHMARTHDMDHKRVRPKMYPPFKAALVDTACGPEQQPDLAHDEACREGTDVQDRLRRAWEEVLQPGVAYMADHA